MTKPGEVTPSIHPYTTMEAFEADRNNKSAAMATAANNLTYQQSFGTITMEGVTFPIPSDSDASDRHAEKQQQRQPSLQEDETAPPAKRIRRVGKLTPRKVSGGAAAMQPGSLATGLATSLSLSALATANSKVLSKHDEKWNEMFTKLLAYKAQYGSTRVPQCYIDSKLGRWVHYQRVEYWIYQQSGNGKITPDRIERLETIGFEWDPQQARWTQMFEKLLRFKDAHGHCRVPKGFPKDPELANWVRNQRLEHANMLKGQKNRMTPDRLQKLTDIGFKWSSSGGVNGAMEVTSTPGAAAASVPAVAATPVAARTSVDASTRADSSSVDMNEHNSALNLSSVRKAEQTYTDFDMIAASEQMLANHAATLAMQQLASPARQPHQHQQGFLIAAQRTNSNYNTPV